MIVQKKSSAQLTPATSTKKTDLKIICAQLILGRNDILKIIVHSLSHLPYSFLEFLLVIVLLVPKRTMEGNIDGALYITYI